jgi:hypothetical protein
MFKGDFCQIFSVNWVEQDMADVQHQQKSENFSPVPILWSEFGRIGDY